MLLVVKSQILGQHSIQSIHQSHPILDLATQQTNYLPALLHKKGITTILRFLLGGPQDVESVEWKYGFILFLLGLYFFMKACPSGIRYELALGWCFILTNPTYLVTNTTLHAVVCMEFCFQWGLLREKTVVSSFFTKIDNVGGVKTGELSLYVL